MAKGVRQLIWCMLGVAMLGGGCFVLDRQAPLIVWPPPPAQPRMEFVGTFSSDADFPQASLWERVNWGIDNHDKSAMLRPYALCGSDGGVVFVSDPAARNVAVFDFSQSRIFTLAQPGILSEPLGVTHDGHGNLYIADGGKRTILVFTSTGVHVRNIGDANHFQRPDYLAINKTLGRLYVSDSKADRVAVFSLAGRQLFTIGRPGSGSGEFNQPHGLAIDGQGRIYVADTGNSRIQVFSADGDFLYAFGQHGHTVHHLLAPVDLSFDSDGHLYVLDRELLVLLTMTRTGEVLLATGTGKRSKGRVGLAYPSGLHIDLNDRIYIADGINRRFVVWQYLGGNLRKTVTAGR